MKIEIKIQFQKNLAEVFNVEATGGDGIITGYTLEDVHITCDQGAQRREPPAAQEGSK